MNNAFVLREIAQCAALTNAQMLFLHRLAAEMEKSAAAVSERGTSRDDVLAEVERGLHDLKNLKIAASDREQARGVAAAEFHVRALRAQQSAERDSFDKEKK